MKTEKTKVNKSWTTSEERQIIDLRSKGMSPEQIAQTVGRSVDSVRLRLIKIQAIERKRKGLERGRIQGRYFVKMTDFNTCKVITYKEVVIAEHGNSSRAWDYAMRLIREGNIKSAKKNLEEFYWVKYL